MKNYTDLLSINWFDGLVLRRALMEQTDARVAALSALGMQLVNRPGVLVAPNSSRAGSQLVTLVSADRTGDGVEVEVTLARDFLAVPPSGRMVVGLRSAPSVRIRYVPRVDEAVRELLVTCERADDSESIPTRIRSDSTGENIEVKLPAFRLGLQSTESFVRAASVGTAHSVCVSLLKLVDDNQHWEADLQFLPAAPTLHGVTAFDDEILPAIEQEFESLQRFVSKNISRLGGFANPSDEVGRSMLRRRSDYELLRALLVGNSGLVRNLESITPFRFCCEVIQPLAVWWINYKDEAFPGGITPALEDLTEVARRLQQLRQVDLFCDLRFMLSSTHMFLNRLQGVLG